LFDNENGSVHMVEPVCLSILYKASDSTFVAFYQPWKRLQKDKKASDIPPRM
jgi:hypothetical protein